MCKIDVFESTTCEHQWLKQRKACSEGATFQNCGEFRYPKPKYAAPHTCPACDATGLDRLYDRNFIILMSRVPRVRDWEDWKRKHPESVEGGCGCVVM